MIKIGDLVHCVHPKSIRDLNVVGLVIEKESSGWCQIWIPELDREIAFHDNQLEKIRNI